MNNDNLKGLYETLKREGYEPPVYEQFEKDMQDEKNLQGAYQTLKNEGYEPPAYETFRSDMGFGGNGSNGDNGVNGKDGSTVTQQHTQPVMGQKPQNGVATQIPEQGSPTRGLSQHTMQQPQYSQEVYDRYDNQEVTRKGVNDIELKSLEDIAAEMEAEKAGSSKAGNGLVSRALGAFGQHDAQNAGMRLGVEAAAEPLPAVKQQDTQQPLEDPLEKRYAQIVQEGNGQESPFQQMVVELLGSGKATTPVKAQQMAYDLNYRYADKTGSSTVGKLLDTIGQPTPEMGTQIDNGWYNEGVQSEIETNAKRLGLNYDDYVRNHVKPAMQRELEQRYGYSEHDAKVLSGRMFENPEHVRKQMEYNTAGNIIGKFIKGAVRKEFSDLDRQASPLRDALDMSGESFLYAKREYNKQTDPDKILSSLLDKQHSLYIDLLTDSRSLNQIQARADALGIGLGDYLDQYVAPQLNNAIVEKFRQVGIERELPKDTMDYVLGGFEDSVGGMLLSRMMNGATRQEFKNEALAMTEAGENPYMDGKPGLLAQGGRLATGMAADFWLWGGWGKIGSKATQQLMKERIAHLAAERGVTEAVAYRLAEEEAGHYLKKGVVNNLFKHVPQSAITMSGAEATTAAVQGIRDRQDMGTIINNTVGQGVHGAFTGTAFGLTGGLMGGLTQGLTGAKRLLGKLAGLEVEAATLYTTEELARMANGEEAFDNPFEGLVESNVKLGFIKASANPVRAIGRLFDAVRHPVKALRAATESQHTLTDEDVADIMSSNDGRTLMDALTAMRPADNAREPGNRLGEVSVEDAEKSAAAYRDFMTDPDRPWIRKQKVARLLGGMLPPPGLEVSAEQVNNGDGTWSVRTRDYDGQTIRLDKYDSLYDADVAIDDMERDLDTNRTEALRQRIDMYDAYRNYSGYLEAEYETAVQKMRSGAELTDGEKQVVYLHQHRGEMLDIQNKLNDGEELSEEENRLGHIYTERFNDYVRRGSASDAFTREWEKANGLPEGSVEQAIYSPERDETQQRIADAYREAMEERIEELKTTRQERDDERTIETIGAIEASAQPQPAEKKIDGVDGNNGSAGYLRGRAAIMNGDGGEMRRIGHEVNVADARIARMFSKEEAAAIYQAVESGDEVALAAVTQQQTEPAKRDAIMKLADALDAARGMDAAFDEQTAGIEGEVRAEAERYQSEDGRIVPLTLSDGSTAFLMNGDPENEYGTVNVAYTDEDGQVQHKQIAARDITSIGEAEPTDAYVARRTEELIKEQEGNFKNQIGGVDLRTGNTVELTMAGQTAAFRIDGFFENGDLQLSDEGGEAMRMSRDEVIGMIRATEEKRVGEELDAEEKALKEAEKARKEAEKAEAERLKGVERDRRAQIEEIRDKVLKDSNDFKDGDMGVMGVMGDMGETEKYLLEHFDSEVDADAFIREQRVALRNYQRDEVQPKIDALQRDLDSYARSEREMTPEELAAVIQQHTQLMRQQEFLNGQAQKLKDASKRVGKIYSGKVGTQGLDATDSRSRRLLTLQKARSYEDKLKKARELYAGDAEASSLFDFESMEPKTIEEYAAEFLGAVPEQGKGIIDFESLQEETGHGGRRVGGDSRGYSAYLAPKGKGESIKALAHKMWERLPEQLHENWTDQDCRNALIEVLSSAQVPTDIRDYILNDRINQAEKYLRAQEEYEEELRMQDWAEAYHIPAGEREAYEESIHQIGEEYSSLTDDDIQKINAIFAEKYESRDEQDRRSQEMDRQPVAAGDGGEGAGGQGEIRPLSSETADTQDQGRPDSDGQDVGKDKDAAAAPVVSDSDVAGGAQGGVKTDGQGNPIDAAGKLIIEKVDRIDDITDEDFSNPTRSIELPKIPQNVDNAIGGDGKPVVIKKNILEKNSRDHSDLTPEQSREILFSALYNPSLYGQNRKATKPHNWVVISTKNTEGKNRLVLLEVNNTKDNVEIVHWHYVRDKALETIKRQAEREGGQILILPSEEEAGGLSSRTLGSSSVGKDTENISNLQENGEKVAAKQQPAEKSASIQGIEGYDADEVLNAVRGDIEMKLEDAGIDGVTIKGMALHGSRMRGDAREDSDLDVVVEYEGDFSEDGLFNILNEVPTVIEGITVDINPITKGKSGTLEEYMERSRKYDEEKTPSRPPRGEEDKGLKGFKERLAMAVEETNTEPTEGQKEAGNYKKGHLSFGGYNYTVENPKGSVRSGKDASGKPWSITMNNTYGYLTGKGHLGKDGDHLDVFINDDADLDTFGLDGDNGKIYIIDQVNADGSFDEHKIMWGFNSEVDAIRNYLMNYSRPWHGLGNITGVDKATFDKWVESSDRKMKPFAETRFGDKRDVAAKVMGEVKRRKEISKPAGKEVSNKNKIEDVGEVIAGARKDMRRKIAESIDSATKKMLTELPFSKAYKKPDLKKAVEEGALREEDATFYDAFFSTMVNQSKPKITQSEMRMKKWKPDYRTNVERWAENTHKSLQVLKEFVEATEDQRDEIIRKALENKYPTREAELAEIEKRKEWNKGSDFKAGDKTTPNPLWVTYEVMKQLDYKPGEKLDIPYGILKADAHGMGYYLTNAKNEQNYNFHPQSIEDGISDIVWLAKLKRGDSDIQHPMSSFSTPSTKRELGESGKYRVVWGGLNIKTRDFDSKKEADDFAASRKQQAIVSPIMDVVRLHGFKVTFRHPLTNEKIVVSDQEFDTKDEAQAYLEENYDALNEKLNDILSAQGKDKKKKELTADDLVYVAMVRGDDNKWTHGVVMDKKYANNYGMPRVLKEGFATRDEAKKYAESIKNEVFNSYKSYKDRQKDIVYFDTGENSRLGEDYRGGKDVSAEDFMNTFGFRGVQFGNWTNQADRQMAVNQAYDAFLDLAKLIGVSPQALSLNGELGIAFGARGVGGFAAHYEPGEIVINLTKTQGAGSLAHEWWHALDNYFARAAGEKGGMVTDDSSLEMRPELRKAYNTLTKQVEASKYFARSKAKGDYWGRMHEVTARLLAEWVDQELKKRGELNTFLSRGVNTERTMENNYLFHQMVKKMAGEKPLSFEEFKKTDDAMHGSPYPSKAEVQSFADAVRNIFDVMQERRDEETGNIMLYEPDSGYNAQEPTPRRRNPKVVSYMEGDLFATAKPQPTEKDLFGTEERRNSMAKIVSMRPVEPRLDNWGLTGDYPYLQSFKKDNPDALAAQDDGKGGMVFRGIDAVAVENITGLKGGTVKGVRELTIPSANVDRYLPVLVKRGKRIAVIDPENPPVKNGGGRAPSVSIKADTGKDSLRQLLESKKNRDADYLRQLIRQKESYISQLKQGIPEEERLYEEWQRAVGTKNEEKAQRAYEDYYAEHEEMILAWDEARNELEDLYGELGGKLSKAIEKKQKQLEGMSDKDLLDAIGKEDSTDRYIEDVDRQDCIEEYDLRHKEEYDAEVESYMKMLDESGTELDEAYGMYSSVSGQWAAGGYHSDERTKLRAQIDVLEEYVDRLESEAIEREEAEEEEAEEEEAAAQQQPTEKRDRYEEDKTAVRAHGYDLTKLRLRDLGEGETSHVERRYVENGSFSFTGGERIESAADVAYIFRQLEDSAVENSFMVLIKDGVPTVIHLAIGSYNGVMAPIEQAFVAYKEIDPDKVLFLHNHPSGSLKASREDLALQKKMEVIFGNKALPGIIIDTKSGKYAEFTGGSTSSYSSWEGKRPDSVEKDIPVRVFNFSKQVFSEGWNPETAFEAASSQSMAAFVSSHRLGDHKKLSLIVTDTAGHITGNVFLPWTSMEEIGKGKTALQIATYVQQMGGKCAFIYGNTPITDNRGIGALKTNLEGHNVYLRDVLTVEGSAYERGVLYEPEMEYKGSAKEMMEAVGKRYHGKEMVFLDKTHGEEQILKDLGLYDEAAGLKGTPKYEAIMKDFRKNLEKTVASYNRDTKKIYIFAPDMTSSYAEEVFFHENIHAILDDWYGGGKRGIADRFWDVMPDDGKVSKTYVKEKSSDESEYAEEAFAYWLSRSMKDGDVSDFLNYFDDADKKRINNILKTLDYDTEEESGRRVRLRRNQHVSEAQSGYSETHQGTGGKASGGAEEGLTDAASEPLPAENTEFSIRQEAAPRKTGIGYKVFVLKDGKLYPPMVANPGGEDTPVGVWLNADAAPVSGTSKTGRPQVKAGGKGTQGSSGQLAYRPGWHLGVIPYALQFGRKDPVTGEKTLFPNNFVWAEVEYANDVDYQEEARQEGINANGKYQHSLAGLKHLPIDGSYMYRTNPDPNTDPWIITGAMRVKRVLKPSEVDELVKAAGREPQKRQEGFVTDEQVENLNKAITLQRDKEREAHELATKAVMQVLGKSGVKYHEVSQEEAQDVLKNAQLLHDGRSFHVDTPVFVSNALKAVEGIKQEKATPEQWLKMIEKNGGLKAGEDKWMGLSDWLNQRKTAGHGGSITKQEVLDFIRENQIQVEEVNYREYLNVDDNPQMKEFRTEFGDIVKKLEDEKESVEQEANAFNDEMYQKYGEGWANDPDRLSEEDLKRNDEMIERWNRLNDEDLQELAFREMVEKYGDDFGMAFEYNYGNGKLEPQMDMYGDNISDAAKHFLQFEEQPINSTRLSYTTDGLDNKKEIALVVPTVESWNEGDEIHFGDAGEGRAVAWVRFGETEGVPNDVDADRYHDYSRKMKEAISRRNEMVEQLKRYKGGMLTETQKRLEEEETYIQQLRERYKDVADVKPTRVLVIDEIQSKRHQEGREKGYKKELPPYTEDMLSVVLNEDSDWEIGEDLGNGNVRNLSYYPSKTMSREEAIAEFIRSHDRVQPGIPDAPFEKNWHELAMKRMLRYAAENGYDKVAWTKGEQQAERYSLSKAFDSVEREDNPSVNGRRFVFSGRNVENFVVDDEGKVIDSTINDSKGKNLSELVGKDMAVKLMALENGDIIEDGLRIGGEGMKGFYDQMLPRFMDKYGKKWGVKTGEVKLPNIQAEGNPSGTVATMWAVDVTPEMRESVMQGQPMFSAGSKEPLVTSEGVVYGYTDGKDIYLTPEGINPETPAHEYGHLWVKAVKKNRPDLWENIKDLMRVDENSQKVYRKLLGDENYSQIHDNEDKLYEEVLTQMGGQKNRERFEQAAREVIDEAPTAAEAVKVASVISRIRRAFRKLWDWIGKSLFQIKKFRSVDEVTDRMMYDFVEGNLAAAKPLPAEKEAAQPEFQVGKGKPRKMKGEGMAHYFERLREWDQREKAKKDAAEDGIMEPSREQADAKAHADWARDHAEWERNPDGKAEPMEWDYSQKAEKEYREALQAYEKKIDSYMPERTPELTKEDVIVEREMQVKTPAQKLMNDISEHLAREYDPYTARDAVKDAVIQRRKDIEEVSADDSIYIEGIRRETNRLADELMAKMGVDGARLKTVKLLQTMSDGKVKPQVTGGDIRRAIPYFIEAPMRRRDIANEANEALEHLGYPARFTADNIKRAEKELDAIRDEAQELLALHKEMAEDGRTEMTVEEQGLYGRVREGARKVADAMNGGGAAAEPQPAGKGSRIGADDVMATLSILTKRVKPEGLKVSEDMPELQPIIGKAKDWYAVAYGWLEDAGMRPDDIGYYKDYVNHVWDKERSDPEAYERYVANRQPTKSRNMRKREIRTLMDGEELGLVPKYDDIADLMGEYSKTNIQSWANKKMLVDLSGIDVVERDESGEPTSMMSLLTSRTPGAFDMDKYDYFEIAGVGPVWVHKAAAKNFGLVFETYEPGKLMGTYDKAASIAKNIELAWSGFHAAALTEVYVAQNVTRPKRATENFYKYLIHDSLLQGQPPAYADPELYKDAARHLVKLGATGDYAPEAMKQVSEQLKDFFGELRMDMEENGGLGKAVGMVVGIPEVVATAVKLVNEGMDKALWTWLHDGLKLCQYKMFREDVMAKAEKEGWSRDRIDKALDEAGQYINDEFGGQHFEVIGVSPKTLRMMRRFLLSPDWLLSTQRHFLATFGFGSIYNKANVRNFRDFYRNVWHRGKGNEGQYDGRYSRAKASLACYVLGCMIMYPLVMNALNALLRKKDEEYEAQMEQENPGYVSKYKLAYPEGMKGFEWDNLSLNPFNSFNIFGDYGMGSNAEGKKSHLFAGRYGDNTEMYIRWGKQFREFPELFETEQGELGFPGPLLKRLMGKSNPNIRFLYDTLNYYTRWDKSKSDEDLEAKWKAWIGDGKLQRNIGIPVGVGANKLWQNYLPFWVPTQSDKEWKPTDMILPSTKGFTPYKARNYFMEFIKAGDEDGIKETFKASVLNGMTSAQISRAFDAARKAVENESRELQLKDGNDIHSVTEAFDASQDLKERKELNSRIRKMLAADAEPPQDWNEFMTTVRAERDGTTEGVTKASEKYLMVATSADVLEDARLAQLKKKASEMKRIHDSMKDNKADGRLLRQWEQQNQKWLDAGKMIKDGESGSESKQGILFWKKQMTGKEANDRKALEMIRKKRKSLLKAVGERVK